MIRNLHESRNSQHFEHPLLRLALGVSSDDWLGLGYDYYVGLSEAGKEIFFSGLSSCSTTPI